MKAIMAWWARLKTRLPVRRKAAWIAKRQQELDNKMMQLEQIVDERDRARRELER